jgi:hypothetical protein
MTSFTLAAPERMQIPPDAIALYQCEFLRLRYLGFAT